MLVCSAIRFLIMVSAFISLDVFVFISDRIDEKISFFFY